MNGLNREQIYIHKYPAVDKVVARESTAPYVYQNIFSTVLLISYLTYFFTVSLKPNIQLVEGLITKYFIVVLHKTWETRTENYTG